MTSAKSVGRMIGILSLVQGAGGFVVNFVLLAPVMTVPPGFLANAAGSALQVRVSVLLGLATGAVTIGIAIAAWPVFRRYSQRMALWFLALGVVGYSLLALENIFVLTMLSLSQEYAKASATHELDRQGVRRPVRPDWCGGVKLDVDVASRELFGYAEPP